MVYDKVIEGKYVDLKAASVEDAEFTLALRQDPEMTQYLPRLDITVEQQRQWIGKQRERAGDYFFVVWDKNKVPIGTTRVYDIQGDEGETGSLAVRGNAFQNMEARFLCDKFAFEILNLERTHSVINVDNVRVQHFSEAFGTVFGEPCQDARGFMCRIGANNKKRSAEFREKVGAMLYGKKGANK